MKNLINKILLGLIGITLICLLPFWVGDYYLFLLVLTCLNAYMATSWNIIGGMGGQLALGHAAFFGLSGYTSTFLFQKYGLSPWAGMWIGMVVSALYGALIGLLCFRYKVRGTYFALVTLAFVEILRIIFVNLKTFGGSEGIVIGLKGHSWRAFQFESKVPYYFIILLMLAALVLTIHHFRNTRFISYLRAIREDEEVAQALGIDVFKIKFWGLILSACLTSLGGAFYAQYVLYIDPPSMFGLTRSFDMVFICIMGGMGTILGPVLGSVVFSAFMEVTNAIFKGGYGANHLILYGILLMVVILVFPRGLITLFPTNFHRRKDAVRN
ncbi:MAG: branched-chain amino acid ABC transporter permease [Deltaproteobacteria bacterium]|nr:branched-chain amino acid ABC transporter permease [Deltaproteobacteria bacterium]